MVVAENEAPDILMKMHREDKQLGSARATNPRVTSDGKPLLDAEHEAALIIMKMHHEDMQMGLARLGKTLHEAVPAGLREGIDSQAVQSELRQMAPIDAPTSLNEAEIQEVDAGRMSRFSTFHKRLHRPNNYQLPPTLRPHKISQTISCMYIQVSSDTAASLD